MGRKVAEKYILFTGDAHENMKFDFTHKQIEIFISLWNAGVPIDRIAKRFLISHANVALIVMDLEMAGRIGPRVGGLLGKQKVVS
ncbi:hypothetical protein [Lysinibacillus sp. NPDC086135]|uniref:hypothetical protein n=1 Tax=Lysinibacillus sp. NPDC086135 TaxID=3364130 RepID=UPI00382C9C6F